VSGRAPREASGELLDKQAHPDLSALVAAAPSSSEALRHALGVIAAATGWPVARALVPGPDGRLRTAGWHLADARYEPFRQVSEAVDADAGLPGKAWAEGGAMWVEDLTGEPAFLRRQAAAVCGLRAAALLPLEAGDERLGLVELFTPDVDVIRHPAARAALEGMIADTAASLVDKRRSEALSEGQARFRAVFDGPLGMATLDDEMRILDANPALGSLLDASPAELRGRAFVSLLRPADEGPSLQSWVEQLAAIGHALIEAQLQRADATPAPVAVRGWATEQGDDPVRWSVLVDPQTERRRSEESLNTRAARRGVAMELVRSITSEADLLRAVAESARGLVNAHLAAVALSGVDGTPFEVFVPAGVPDVEAARIGSRPLAAGVLSAMVLENRPLRIADVAAHPASAGLPEGHPAISSFLGLPLVAGGQTIGHLFVANRFDGQPFDRSDEDFLDDFAGAAAAAIAHVRTTAQARTATSRLRQLVRANLDLIQQARRDTLPRSAVELLRTVTDAEYAALILLDPADGSVRSFLHAGLTPPAAGRIGDFPAARGLFHAAMTAGRPMRLTDLRHHPTHGGFPAHHPVMRSFLSVPVSASGQSRGLLFCTNKRSLSDFTSEDEESALRIASAVATAVETQRDEGDSLLRNLAVASERLREEEARHWRFLGSLSHELRSSVGGILMSADLLSDPAFGALTEDKMRGVGGRIGTTARSVMELIDNLLDLSRIQAGRLEVRMQPVDVQPILAEVLAQLGPVALEAGVTLDAAPLSPSTPRILADPVRLRQVLVNLVGNAVKFTPRHGNVVVEVQGGEQDVCVAVSDTGVGIDPADLQRLFEPFERAQNAQAPGTGLGLAISRAIMELHGGRLEAESWPGVGSRFLATFRVARLPHYTAEVEQAVADEGPLVPGRGVVLLVEDDESSRESTISVLMAAGYRVHAVATRAAAVALIPTLAVDLVLLDVHLPDGDGLGVVAELRALAGSPGPRVVAFSADRIGNTEERARAVCDDFILKPLRPRELLRRVGELVRR
jgi:signal transduction histidine kinase/CheY-like chemotaxis protein/PAS domain-containing protein